MSFQVCGLLRAGQTWRMSRHLDHLLRAAIQKDKTELAIK